MKQSFDDEPTAIFYAIERLGAYQVEMRKDGESYFIPEENQIAVFANIAEAKNAARSHGAKKGMMAISSSSQEMIQADPTKESFTGFDLMPVKLEDN